MYGFRMRPMGPYLNRNHWYLKQLLKNGMYNQYQALRTPSNSLWKQYGFSLYGNAGNGKYTVPGQTRRKKRSTYGGYGDHYGGSGYGDSYGSYGSGSDYSSGYGNNDYGGYGNNYASGGYGDNYGGGYGGSGYNDGGYGDNYGGYSGGGYSGGGYSGGGYSGGGYNDGGYGTGYGDNYGGYGGGYNGGWGSGYSRKKRSLYSPMIHGVKGYYGKGFQALANFAAK